MMFRSKKYRRAAFLLIVCLFVLTGCSDACGAEKEAFADGKQGELTEGKNGPREGKAEGESKRAAEETIRTGL